VDLEIADLVAMDGFLRACSAFIKAMMLTDARFEVSHGAGRSWTVGAFTLPRPPDLVYHLTDDPPPEDREATQLTTVTPHSFVIFLTAAWGARSAGMLPLALRIANELDRHLEKFAAGAPNEAQLEVEPDAFCGLTVGDLRAALACLGIKVARQLYRLPPEGRARTPLDTKLAEQGALTTPRLLSHVERYARLHSAGAPHSPVGAFSLAWAARQGADGLVEATRWAGEAVRLADASEDDVVRATARIDLATYLIGGGEQRVVVDGRPEVVPGATGELVEWRRVFELAAEAEEVGKQLAAWGMDAFLVESYGQRIVDGFRTMVREANDGRGLAEGEYALACNVGIGEQDRG
jgi:hypothetical protein